MGLRATRAVGTISIVVSAVCCSGADAVTVQAPTSPEPPASDPGQVTDLTHFGDGVLTWTQVDDGTGGPASYAIRHGCPNLTWGSASGTEVTISGTAIGSPLAYETGQIPGSCEWRLMSYRGTLTTGAVLGPVSNVVTIEVAEPIPGLILVQPYSFTLQVGETTQLTATVFDSDNQLMSGIPVSWVSTAPLVATVVSTSAVTAQVTALSIGDVTIEARIESAEEAPEASPVLPSGSFGLPAASSTQGPVGIAAGVVQENVGGLFLSDDFESGDLETADGGFRWLSTTDASVVADHAHSGSHSLRFSYEGKASGGDAWAEARFDLPPSQELWFDYYIYLPDGTEGLGTAAYAHRDDTGADNNKFWKIAESHSGASVTALLEAFPEAGNGGIAKSRPMWGNPADGVSSSTYGLGGSDPIVKTEDLGGWSYWRFHLKISDPGASNGVWRMWKNGDLIVDGTGIANDPSDSDRNKYLTGYLMGWSNSGFDQDTYVWLDDLRFFSADPGW